MKISGKEIQPLYELVVETHRKYDDNDGKLNGLIKCYNKLFDRGYQRNGQDFFEDLLKIELVAKFDAPNQELEDHYHEISEKFIQLEFNLTSLYSRFYAYGIKRPSENETFSVNQKQEVSQKQEVTIQTINSFNQAIELINKLKIDSEEKDKALKNIKELQDELKKDKPSQSVIRRLLFWAIAFDTTTGIPVLQFVANLMIESWDKIFI